MCNSVFWDIRNWWCVGLLVGEREGSVVDEGPQPQRDASQPMAAPSRLPPVATRPPVRCQLLVKGKPLNSKVNRSSNEDQRRDPSLQGEELVKKDGGFVAGVVMEFPKKDECDCVVIFVSIPV